MYGVLRAHGKRYWIAPFATGAVEDAQRLLFRDKRHALLFLRELAAVDRQGYANVRRLLSARRVPFDPVRLNDDAVLQALAARIASCELWVHAVTERIPNYHFPAEVEEVLPPVVEAPRPPPPEVETPPPPAPAEFEDVEAQVAVLREAAEQGAPFCEECEKARQEQARIEASEVDEAAQAEALVAAAEKGAPFCEECEKAKLAAAAAETRADFESVDAPAQAEALVAAAEKGAPFCEECEKAKLAAAAAETPADFESADAATQAATLVTAADEGTPFCEECEKAKKGA